MLARYMGQYGKQKHCAPVETGKKAEAAQQKPHALQKSF